MTADEQKEKKSTALSLLKVFSDRANELDNGIPNLCKQILDGDKYPLDLVEVVKEIDVLNRSHDIALAQFEAIIFPPTVENNQKIFFEALDEIRDKKTVTSHDIDCLDKLVVVSDQLTQDALIEFKQRTAH